MALLSRLRRLLGRPAPTSRVGARRPTGAPRHGDLPQEDALRSRLGDDPNDERAFAALAEIVRRHAVTGSDDDPLTAEADDAEKQRAADLAVWSLGEELAGNPRAWYPLVEVARLSVRDDLEGTVRRLTTAAERDPSGRALVAGLRLLREAGLPVDALSLGTGHWHPREHDPEVGRELVLAAVEAGRPLDAKQHLASLDLYPKQDDIAHLRRELTRLVEQAERHAGA
ncbi:hypothetical protein KQI48_10100 [Cellulomonas hominis]|jgi:hypothetical protein|uniref:Uncharacterized protein n=1 Tax=Cellulomonas hominis TaxID=156981 RepID=A0A511FEK3_9CELL|nr:hypothetical protein [Cellulomonas hominis]MBB5471335.1 hypothetical protein [Cellulomonas hominis]MBU5423016.1 hypothetical protein [Cellulomonas hominis]NKY09715.1 hypothetical protein [Cellulomonas hominis]GEL47643.1 hypothetical protein CHO01_27590 [Cellulomonas hominis]